MKYWVKNLNLDWVGFSASVLCAIHCAVLPFVLSLGPLAGLRFLTHPGIEPMVIIFSFVVASVSLGHGYRKHHSNKTPLVVVIFGFLLIGTGHFFHYEWLETSLTVMGASLIAVAHLINWKYVRVSQKESSGYPIQQKLTSNA